MLFAGKAAKKYISMMVLYSAETIFIYKGRYILPCFSEMCSQTTQKANHFSCRLPHSAVHKLEDMLVEVVDKLGEVLVVGVGAEPLPPHPVHLEELVDAAIAHHPGPRLLVPTIIRDCMHQETGHSEKIRGFSHVEFWCIPSQEMDTSDEI